MKKSSLFIFILALFNCVTYTNVPKSAVREPSYADTLAILDTAYVDPVSAHIKPPCSMSPDYCECIKSRLTVSGIRQGNIPGCQ
jgi:hypothetical protein